MAVHSVSHVTAPPPPPPHENKVAPAPKAQPAHTHNTGGHHKVDIKA